jgi:hypothetical protein
MWVDNIKMDVKWIGGEGVDWKDEVKVLFFWVGDATWVPGN